MWPNMVLPLSICLMIHNLGLNLRFIEAICNQILYVTVIMFTKLWIIVEKARNGFFSGFLL